MVTIPSDVAIPELLSLILLPAVCTAAIDTLSSGIPVPLITSPYLTLARSSTDTPVISKLPVEVVPAVSYTHLTLPTILLV